MSTRIAARLRPGRVVAAAVALLGLFACGLGPSSGDQATGSNDVALPDPCQLLTLEEIGAVQGGPTDPGIPGTGQAPGHRACVFGQHDDIGTTTSITVFAGGKARFDAERSVVAENFPVEDIPGLGDGAFIGASVLHVRKGDLIVTLFTGSSEAEAKKNAIALAPKALARM